jgi:glutamate/tyrosine decarboxylase-like PLP-dependent enzyme
METINQKNNLVQRTAALEMSADEFRRVGHDLIEQIATFLEDLPQGKVTKGEKPKEIKAQIGEGSLPLKGVSAEQLFSKIPKILFEHSLFNGHPKFMGYITSSAAPIGALGDLLAATVNPNCGGYNLSPVATEIEKQTIQWIAELIGYPANCGGILVSGGNMANFVGFLAGRTAKANWDIRKNGVHNKSGRFVAYCSTAVHTWLEKGMDIYGFGTDSIRKIETNSRFQMKVDVLEDQIKKDIDAGFVPFLVVGTAGSVSTGAIDPLIEIAAICRKYELWFHVDGAYGAPAAVLPEASEQLKALSTADSVAVDPHKWLYNPLEAGCTLVRNPKHLTDTFSFHPEYYNFDSNEEDPSINFYEYGPQNSRGFRALKVWLGIQQAGREGFVQMIRDDIALSNILFKLVSENLEFEPFTNDLSITTFRYVPKDLDLNDEIREQYLNRLNETLVTELQANGEAFLSNAIIDGKYCLRACIVNFRTTLKDIEAIPEIVLRTGKAIDIRLRQ